MTPGDLYITTQRITAFTNKTENMHNITANSLCMFLRWKRGRMDPMHRQAHVYVLCNGVLCWIFENTFIKKSRLMHDTG